MRLKRFTYYLLDHLWVAAILTFAITFVPVVGIAGVLIAALVTLRKSTAYGALLTAVASLPYVISFYLAGQGQASIPLGMWAAVGVAILSNLFTFVFAVMLKRQTAWSVILQVAALIGVLAISIIHLVYPNIASWWASQLHAYYEQAQAVTTALKTTAVSGATSDTVSNLVSNEAKVDAINVTKQYATGMMVGAVLLNAVLQLIVAKWWEALVYQSKTLGKELRNIRLSHLAAVLFVISLGLAHWDNAVVLDMMPVMYMLFTMAALSLIHYMFKFMQSNTSWFWLLLGYLILLLTLPYSMVIISLLAVLDSWVDLRKRLKKV